MSYANIMIHCVWATHNREKILSKDERLILFKHIKDSALERNIFVDTINGYLEHVHCLISLNADQSVAQIMQLLKGEASFWANKEKLLKYKLRWADDYFAASVGITSVQKVRAYIKNQEEHHRNVTFEEEYQKFIKAHGVVLHRSHHQ